MASESRLICISYLAPHASHLMLPMLWSKSIVQPQRSLPPQKGQSNTCDTFGFAFWGGGLARFRLPLWQGFGRGQGLESAAVCGQRQRVRGDAHRKGGWGAKKNRRRRGVFHSDQPDILVQYVGMLTRCVYN